jgi:membrane protein required for colicin V production
VNWTDGVILAVLALSVLVGLFRGLVAEVLSLVIWVAAFWFTWAFGPVASTYLEHTIAMPELRSAVGYGICFVLVLIVGALVRFALRRLIWSSGLSGIDRLFGMVFGFLRGVLIVAALVFLLGLTGLTREPWWQQSLLVPQFQSIAAWLGQVIPAKVPAEVRDRLHPKEMLDKIHPQEVIDKIHSSQVLEQLHDLSKQHPAPISGASANQPTPDHVPARPSPAASAPDDHLIH